MQRQVARRRRPGRAPAHRRRPSRRAAGRGASPAARRRARRRARAGARGAAPRAGPRRAAAIGRRRCPTHCGPDRGWRSPGEANEAERRRKLGHGRKAESGTRRALSMNRFTLAHVSDLHLPFEPRLTLRQRLSKRQLSALSWRRRRHLHRPRDPRRAGRGRARRRRRSCRRHRRHHQLLAAGRVPPGGRLARGRSRPAARLSLVPGNHDALVPVAAADGLDHWADWTRSDEGWPFVHRLGGLALIGLNSALPTAPLLARGRLGAAQLAAARAGARGRRRGRAAARSSPCIIRRPQARSAGARRSPTGRRSPTVLRRAGAELVLHGHARDARLDALARSARADPVPVRAVVVGAAEPPGTRARAGIASAASTATSGSVEVEVRRWSPEAEAFVAGRQLPALPAARPRRFSRSALARA